MMRIGIFGGAFDPPHKGHEKALKTFYEKAQLDRVFVIPSGSPPHKKISGGAKASDRMEMARRAFLPISDSILVSDMEIRSESKSYAYLTVEKIRSDFPDAELFLFIGTDQFLSFEKWARFEFLLKECTLAVMDRFENKEALFEQKEHLKKDFDARCLLLEEKPYIISSTEIRSEMLKKGFSHSLSPKVNEYISEAGIYSVDSDSERAKIVLLLKENLSSERFWHTLAVERETDRLCEIFLFSEEEARKMRLAALFHDLTKEKSFEEQIAMLLEKGDLISEDDLASPAVLHGKTAAILMEREGIFSEEEQNAVCYHTTGREKMTLREKILYFADYIEETRHHKSCLDIRESFYAELPKIEKKEEWMDRCIFQSLQSTIDHLKEKNLPVHPKSLAAMEDLQNKIGKEFV
jgi:nicotinate-nucleotide adenylyltransferase